VGQLDGMKEEVLTSERLCSGDRPSIEAAGIFVANSIKKAGIAVLMVDVLGRVHIMSPSSVQILKTPKVSKEELNQFSEEIAIQVLIEQGEKEEDIISYLKERQTLESDH